MAKETKASMAEKKIQAKGLYMSTNLTQEELSSIFNVSKVTMNKWVNQENWDAQKNLQKADKETARANLYKALVKETSKDEVDGDKISKITKAIETLSDDRMAIPEKMRVYISFVNFLRKRKDVSIDFIKEVNRYQNEDIQELLNNVN